MERIILTRDEAALLRVLAQSEGLSPGELVRKLLLQAALSGNVGPDAPRRSEQGEPREEAEQSARGSHAWVGRGSLPLTWG